MAVIHNQESLPLWPVQGETLVQPLFAEVLEFVNTCAEIPEIIKIILQKVNQLEQLNASDFEIIRTFLEGLHPENEEHNLIIIKSISYIQLIYYIRSLPFYIEHFQKRTVHDIMCLAMDQRFHFPNQDPLKILNELKKHLDDTDQIMLNFEDISSALILAQIQAYDLSLQYLDRVNTTNNSQSKPILLILTDLIRALIYRSQGKLGIAHLKMISICADLIQFNDMEAMLYALNEWAFLFNKTGDVRKSISALKLIENNIGSNDCSNLAKTLYYLFYTTKYEKPKSDKIRYLENLLQIPNTVLQNHELLHVHFYAGNFYSTIQVNFAESIKHFTKSNYYLMKSWEQLLQNNAFLHDHLPMDELKLISPIFEYRLKDLLNENSLQINQFVEYLEFAYNEQNKLYAIVQELSLTDSMTGLKNRRYLLNNIPHLLFLAKRHKNPISIIMLDIDDFKKINDIYGHLAGDKILHDLSVLIESMFRKSDIIVRYGGEEFLIVLFDAQTDDSSRLAEQLRDAVEKKTFTFQDFNIHITISGGISTHFYDESETEEVKLEDMIALADHALYFSKKHGKNAITTCEQMANKFLMPV